MAGIGRNPIGTVAQALSSNDWTYEDIMSDCSQTCGMGARQLRRTCVSHNSSLQQSVCQNIEDEFIKIPCHLDICKGEAIWITSI